jgi:Uma2 family endonuclease
MPQFLQQPTENVPAPFRIVWTRQDCERFENEGLLIPGKYELIEGEIIRKMPQNRPHSAGVSRLFAWCISVFSMDFVQTQAAINVAPEDNPTSFPEPDVFVLTRSIEYFLVNYPTPADLALVAEVSDSTLAFDLSTKAGLNARAMIREYWVLDVVGRALTVHREPHEGRYQSVVRYAADERVATLAKPVEHVVVSALLPPLAPIETNEEEN